MPEADHAEPIVALTDAPTAEEEYADSLRVLGTVPCLPTGTSRIFMMKAL
jgi:hypothetical protein